MLPSRIRFGLAGGLVAALWVVVMARAFQLQVLDHDTWDQVAIQRQGSTRTLTAERGSILASDGTKLAQTVSNRSLAVDPSLCEDPAALARALDDAGLGSAREFERKLRENSERRFLWLSQALIPEETVDELTARFPELDARVEAKRVYRLGEAASSLVGLINRDDAALGGLESEYKSHLEGTGGLVLEVSDRFEKRYEGLETYVLQEPERGGDIVLAIDSKIQEIAHAHLAHAVETQEATSGFAIVTRPSTGEVLAMVSLPAPNPHDLDTWTEANLKMRAVTDAFEPGSIYKVVPFAAAFEAGRLASEERIDCMDGVREVPGGRPIRDDHPCGIVPAWEVMAKSSNIGAGLIAERVGAEGFYRMEKAFGFGLNSEVELPGEGRGRIPEPSAWSLRSLVTQAFGQEISCTGIQLAMAYGAIANDGLLMKPLLVQETHAADGSVMERREPEAVRRVMRPAVAAAMRTILRGVVTEGTGNAAEVEGFGVAGKTGTAQKYVKELGRYSKERYVASFVGFAPWDDPEVLCVVVLDEPRGSIYGGSVSAPVFSKILADVRPLVGGHGALASVSAPGPTDEEGARRSVPEVLGLTAPSARRVVQECGLMPRFEGEGDRVIACRPPVGARLLPGGIVTLMMDEGTVEGTMPDLTGLSLRDAWLRIETFSPEPQLEGEGWVVWQSPAPGEPVPVGTPCQLRLSPDGSQAWKEFREVEERVAGEFASGTLSGESAPRRRVARR